jgi:protein-S-isoprenylcysteine O-methyltransferase Ste14
LERLLSVLVRYRVLGAFVLSVIFFMVARPNGLSVASGLLISLTGVALRTWASGHIEKGRSLATTGPYSLLRNPLYLGSFLMGLGVCIMGRNPLMTAVFLVLFPVVYLRKIDDEERHLLGKFGREFEEYQARTPKILPRTLRPVPGGVFDWDLVLRHREYQVWLGLAAVTALLAFKML